MFTNRQKKTIRKLMLERLGLKGCEKFLINETFVDDAVDGQHADLIIMSKHEDYMYRMIPLGVEAQYRIVGPIKSCTGCTKHGIVTDSPLYLRGILQVAKINGRWTG